MSEAIDVETLVIGAGAAGLGAALELEGGGREVLVVDAFPHPGGVMATDEIRGYRVERGPNTFQLKPALRAFLRHRSLEQELAAASPEGRKRFILHSGCLAPVPMDPVALARSGLLSVSGKLRLLAEPFIARGDATGESVAQFVGRRLGREAATALVGPFLTGVYAGDERRLGVEAVFPGLVELEREHGGIARGLAARGLAALGRRLRGGSAPLGSSDSPGSGGEGSQAATGSWSAPDGMGQFARALASQLRQPPCQGERVEELSQDGAGWRAQLKSGTAERAIRCQSVVVATSAASASAVLKGVDAELAAMLDAIEYAPIVAIGLGVDPGEVRQPLEGFGFLVPREERLGLLGCLFMSRMFPGRAPAGRELLHCMLGGVRWPEAVSLSDEDLYTRLEGELDRTLGLAASPERLVVHRWPQAVPQPSPDHPRRIAALRQRTRALGPAGSGPSLELAGSYLDGVSVCDALMSGVTAARTILATVSTQSG